MNKRLCFGFSAVCASKLTLKSEVPTSSKPIQLFAKFDFKVRFNISAGCWISAQSHPLGGADRLRLDRFGRLLPVFPLDDLAHEFGRELGVLVREFDPHC